MERNHKTNTHFRKPIYLGYDEIASRVEELVPEVSAQQYNALVIILRGGSFPGMHLAFLTDVPVYFVTYERDTRSVSWNGKIPMANTKVLVVEDFAGSGTTLTDTIDFLQSDYQVHTFVVCKDLLSQIQNPNYWCFDLKEKNARFIVPWEKHEYEDSFK
jgi:hypoxanthine phosphoribosyltransferase